MRLDDWAAVRESFSLTQGEVGHLINKSSLYISRIENGICDPPKGYKQMWIDMSEYREDCINRKVEHMPRARFRGTEKQWVAYKSAVGYVLCQYLASNARLGYNPLFSDMCQPKNDYRVTE